MLKLRTEKGFTLIELMIVVAIIGILAAIAVPNFIAYRNKSRVAAGVGTSESFRGAMAGYAADSTGNEFPKPAACATWGAFASISNANGGTLKPAQEDQGLRTDALGGFSYNAFQEDGITACAAATECSLYLIIIRLSGVPDDMSGCQIEVRSSGIQKQTCGA